MNHTIISTVIATTKTTGNDSLAEHDHTQQLTVNDNGTARDISLQQNNHGQSLVTAQPYYLLSIEMA